MSEVLDMVSADIEFGSGYRLHSLDWRVTAGEKWLLAGRNGSGKSALLAAISGAGTLQRGHFSAPSGPVAELSITVQKALIARELERLKGLDGFDANRGTKVRLILEELNPDLELLQTLIERLDLGSHLAKSFLSLSTGETQKVLMVRALASRHPVLILDEPLEGLDGDAVQIALDCIERWTGERTLIYVTHQLGVLPQIIQQLAFVEAGSILYQGAIKATEATGWLEQMSTLSAAQIALPPKMVGQPLSLTPDLPLVVMNNVQVKFGDALVFEGLNWQINAGEHWQITGPNGSGKTTLLNLITGDSPHCYTNDLKVFGYQRGSGESIWDIKQHIGYVSAGLHLEYRVSASVERVLLSGFFDSIGLYQNVSAEQEEIVLSWLKLIGLAQARQQPFSQQSYGNQRLLLITRAMVKQPALLILDEPCLGLDPLNRGLVIALIKQLTQSQTTTILYVSHDASDQIDAISRRLDLPLV